MENQLMTRFVISGRVRNPGAATLTEADIINPTRLQDKLSSMHLEIEKIESVGDEVTYYLKESAGPKLLCD